MKMIASRELSAKPSAVWADLQSEGAVVITKDGQPVGIITPTSSATLLEDMQEITFAKARQAVTELRQHSATNSANEMSMEEIDAEIRVFREKRKAGEK